MRAPIALPSAANERWSLDFVHDQMVDGRRFRILTVVDDCTRECLALVADTSISGLRVARGVHTNQVFRWRRLKAMLVAERAEPRRRIWPRPAGNPQRRRWRCARFAASRGGSQRAAPCRNICRASASSIRCRRSHDRGTREGAAFHTMMVLGRPSVLVAGLAALIEETCAGRHTIDISITCLRWHDRG